MAAVDCFGQEVKVGDLIVYGSSQGQAKAGFRVGFVLDVEKPTVQPFERYYWGNDPAKWIPLRVFGFSKIKTGDFVIVGEREIKDKEIKAMLDLAKSGNLRSITHTKCSFCKEDVKIEKFGWKDKNGKNCHYDCKYPKNNK